MFEQLSRLGARCRRLHWSVFVVAIGLVGAGVGLAESSRQRRDIQRRAMTAAVNDYVKLAASRDLVDRVGAIDVSRCPKDFQEAHFDLVDAASDLSLDSHDLSPSTVSTETTSRVLRALRRCFRVAESYGVYPDDSPSTSLGSPAFRHYILDLCVDRGIACRV